MDFGQLINQAEALPLDGGSLTFKMVVVQRDWETVDAMFSGQQDQMHGASTLSNADREYLRQEAQKDGYSL